VLQLKAADLMERKTTMTSPIFSPIFGTVFMTVLRPDSRGLKATAPTAFE